MGSPAGQRWRRLARFGGFWFCADQSRSWWPEEVWAKIERIDWMVSGLDEAGENRHEFAACDGEGILPGRHRAEGS